MIDGIACLLVYVASKGKYASAFLGFSKYHGQHNIEVSCVHNSRKVAHQIPYSPLFRHILWDRGIAFNSRSDTAVWKHRLNVLLVICGWHVRGLYTREVDSGELSIHSALPVGDKIPVDSTSQFTVWISLCFVQCHISRQFLDLYLNHWFSQHCRM